MSKYVNLLNLIDLVTISACYNIAAVNKTYFKNKIMNFLTFKSEVIFGKCLGLRMG